MSSSRGNNNNNNAPTPRALSDHPLYTRLSNVIRAIESEIQAQTNKPQLNEQQPITISYLTKFATVLKPAVANEALYQENSENYWRTLLSIFSDTTSDFLFPSPHEQQMRERIKFDILREINPEAVPTFSVDELDRDVITLTSIFSLYDIIKDELNQAPDFASIKYVCDEITRHALNLKSEEFTKAIDSLEAALSAYTFTQPENVEGLLNEIKSSRHYHKTPNMTSTTTTATTTQNAYRNNSIFGSNAIDSALEGRLLRRQAVQNRQRPQDPAISEILETLDNILAIIKYNDSLTKFIEDTKQLATNRSAVKFYNSIDELEGMLLSLGYNFEDFIQPLIGLLKASELYERGLLQFADNARDTPGNHLRC